MRPIAEQRPLADVLSSHVGQNGALCHAAYCSFGVWRMADRPGGDVPVILGGDRDPAGHRVHFFAKSYAATLLDRTQHGAVAREFGVEPFAKAYGLEPAGTGIGLGSVSRYDAYLCVYECDGLAQIGLTEQSTSDPEAAEVDVALDVFARADGARVCLTIPHGYLVGVLRVDRARRRAVVTEGAIDTPSYTVLRPGLAVKPTPSRVMSKAITAEFGSGPTGVYDLHRYCGWKERIEEVGRMYVFD
jgi:hypothetical protein